MKLFIYSLVIVFLLLVACTPKETTDTSTPQVAQTPTPVVQTPTPIVQAPAVPAPPQQTTPSQTSPKPTQPSTEPQRSKELENLLKESDRVQSYEYIYNGPPDAQARDHYYIRGNKIRVDLLQSYTTEILHYNMVYIDNTAKTAFGYCKGNPPRCRKEYGITELKYEDYVHPTPLDWIALVKEHATTLELSELINGKKTKGTSFEFEGKTYTIYMDTLGMPLRVEINQGIKSETYNYLSLAINSVSDAQVAMPTL